MKQRVRVFLRNLQTELILAKRWALEKSESRDRFLKYILGIGLFSIGVALLIYGGFVQLSNLGAEFTDDGMPLDHALPFIIIGAIILFIGGKIVPEKRGKNQYRKFV